MGRQGLAILTHDWHAGKIARGKLCTCSATKEKGCKIDEMTHIVGTFGDRRWQDSEDVKEG